MKDHILAIKLNTNDICVKIWRFYDAPEEYQAMSGHGGDEDWVVLIPKILRSNLPVGLWPLEDGEDEDSYVNGYGHVDRHELENGDLLVIFAHA